jgi:hypothetical protein
MPPLGTLCYSHALQPECEITDRDRHDAAYSAGERLHDPRGSRKNRELIATIWQEIDGGWKVADVEVIEGG